MPTGLFTHPSCYLHLTGSESPESPERITAIEERLVASGLMGAFKQIETDRAASREDLLRAHDEEYLKRVESAVPTTDEIVHLTEDTVIGKESLQAAVRAAGCVLEAVDRVLDGTFNKAFCCVRPPGHHAHRNKPGGFCIFNNVAIAALYALAVKGLKRVAVIDIDAHHGDGTEDILQNHEGVHFFSIYQEGIFPHVENTDCAPNVVRAVLKRGDNGDDACEMIRSQWLPQMQQFAPEMIFVSAGFDAHVADIQSGLDFSDLDYAHITRIIDNVAETVCSKKLVSVLEGGYEPRSLTRSVVAHLRTLSHL